LLNHPGRWVKLGRILAPDPRREWMAAYTGPSFALPRTNDVIDVYVTGRDVRNRSRIGILTLNLEAPGRPLALSDQPVFDIGVLGAFDENGVSYPWIVPNRNELYMYYVGWMPTVLTPFQNHVGLATKPDNSGAWSRYSRAPILERTNDEFLSIGSVAVLQEHGRWRMWYTCFRRWGQGGDEPRHVYVIKYAESTDGVVWHRPNRVCIDVQSPDEYAIGRPSVLVDSGTYHMWYSYRGPEYRIGYAWSTDGLTWIRRDDLAGIQASPDGWDSEAICYSHVFRARDRLYMLYCGNRYGRDGLGLARRE
jgi:hypothetical protein